MAGISAASAGSPMSRDNANPPAAKMQSDKTPSANAAAQSGDALTLSEAQRKMAWQDLYMDSLNQNTPPGFDAVVGTTVPNTIVIAPVTAQAGSDVPAAQALLLRDGSEEARDRQSEQPQDRERDRAVSAKV